MSDARITALLRELAPRLVGALVRRHRDLQACEDAVQEALLTASTTWPRTGLPDEPRAWLLHVANRRVIDSVRAETSRRQREELVVSLVPADEQHALAADEALALEHDDSLDLLFLCCHPALSTASAIALTLRTRKDSKYVNPADQVRVKARDRVRIVQMPVTQAARPVVEEAPAAGETKA